MIHPDNNDTKKSGALPLRVALAGATLVLLGVWLVACTGETPAANPPTTQEQQGTGQLGNPDADNEPAITAPDAGVDEGSTEETPQNTEDTDASEPYYMDPDHLDC